MVPLYEVLQDIMYSLSCFSVGENLKFTQFFPLCRVGYNGNFSQSDDTGAHNTSGGSYAV